MTLTKELTAKINEAMGVIGSKFPNIACGGCGLFAKSLGNILEGLGVEFDYVLIHHTEYGMARGNEGINNNIVRDVIHSSWTHVMIKVGNKYIDNEGVFHTKAEVLGKYSRDKYIGEPLGKNLFLRFVSPRYKSGWNDEFNRRQMGGITRNLKKYIV